MASLTNIFIGIVLFCAVFGGMIAVINQSASEYDQTLDQKYFNSEANETARIYAAYNLTKEVSESIEDKKIEQSTLDVVFTGGFTAIKQVTSSFQFAKSIITSVQNALGIPDFIIITILTIILFSIRLFVS